MSSAPTSPAASRSAFGRGDEGRFIDPAVGQHRDPVLDDLGDVPVNLHPCQGFAEDAAVRQPALSANTRAQVPQAPLQSLYLPQPLDISPGERQRAKARRRQISAGAFSAGSWGLWETSCL